LGGDSVSDEVSDEGREDGNTVEESSSEDGSCSGGHFVLIGSPKHSMV
jgi:hypothetical protein